MSARLTITLALALASTACFESTKSDTSDVLDTGPQDTLDTQDTAIPGPCADGGWGLISRWEHAIHVSPEGSADGDGSWADPVSDPTIAIEMLRAQGGEKYLALWPGTHSTNLSLSQATEDSVLEIQGCSVGEVILEAADSSQPVVAMDAVTEVEIEGLTSRGGTRGILIGNAAEVRLRDLRVEQATEVGLLVHGASTEVQLNNVEVHDPVPSDAGLGYGMAFQDSAQAAVYDGGVWGATAAGVLIDGAGDITLAGLTIANTAPDSGGYYGRGVQIQADTVAVTIADATLSANQGAGLFAMQVPSLSFNGSTIEGTSASALPGSHATSGDGVVFTRGDDSRDPASFVGSFGELTITGSARAGLLLDGVTAQLEGVVLTDNAFEVPLAQDSAAITGDNAEVLVGDDMLELNLEPLATVDVGAR